MSRNSSTGIGKIKRGNIPVRFLLYQKLETVYLQTCVSHKQNFKRMKKFNRY